ncbi:MAG TPA: hypothetical protein PK076_02970 [Saprospiraceae bacterium]|nr:hypothetical protein [Saprospiraceae bacterium]HQW55055.1 hypothetical protein [Saprospiraceae bacterium]
MKTIIKLTFTTAILFLLACSVSAQARLTIVNKSMRIMTVKVMKGHNRKATLHDSLTVQPHTSETVYFSTSGKYFTKTKAVYKDKEPVYRKGDRFEVTNNASGYSVLTLTFSIKESKVPQASGGQPISRSEYEEN